MLSVLTAEAVCQVKASVVFLVFGLAGGVFVFHLGFGQD